ncbi:MAG: hypothetical protein GY943_11150 [Chloroflexi bacterium]|nr:hypothetical protein [Chloroflexota bacterium]
MTDARIVVHGFPWELWHQLDLNIHKQMVISNGPTMTSSATVLTESNTKGIVALASRFLANDEVLIENLELLGIGESIVIVKNNLFYTTWTRSMAD